MSTTESSLKFIIITFFSNTKLIKYPLSFFLKKWYLHMQNHILFSCIKNSLLLWLHDKSRLSQRKKCIKVKWFDISLQHYIASWRYKSLKIFHSVIFCTHSWNTSTTSKNWGEEFSWNQKIDIFFKMVTHDHWAQNWKVLFSMGFEILGLDWFTTYFKVQVHKNPSSLSSSLS